MKAVILAGGKGSRLAPYTKVIPKPLMPIGDMPILEVLLRQVRRAGVDEIVLSVGHMASLLRAFFQEGEYLGLNIRYSYEDQPLGTAGPLPLIEGLDQTFLVMNGDVLTTLDFADLLSFHRQSGALVTIAMYNRQIKIDLGVLQLNGGHQISGYIEKPTYNFQVSMGIYVFEPRALEFIPCGLYFDFPSLILRLLENGEKVVGYPFNGYWQDLGRPDDYEQAILDFETMRAQFLGEEL
ncbi:MAG: nucleoside-diphosphate-sugar pyrophosphorylase [Chloroflexi bacterium HGW-Chloroflexi-6]|nr:MAG: nucleoside-diphosphate-sugar pyrophosphorylase [Chloroflexi bacterium HGW-Chloroflexi-6]